MDYCYNEMNMLYYHRDAHTYEDMVVRKSLIVDGCIELNGKLNVNRKTIVLETHVNDLNVLKEEVEKLKEENAKLKRMIEDLIYHPNSPYIKDVGEHFNNTAKGEAD